jgi:AcrR family transcriptional regulator
LESAILDAAWAQLVENGYPAFTYEAIAARAGTSRPVLYRRWPKREDLLLGVLRRFWWSTPIEVPDTGNLRDDALLLLHRVVAGRSRIMTMLGVQLADYFRDSGSNFGELRDMLRGAGRPNGLDLILERAIARGELSAAPLPPRVKTLPMDLLRNDMFMTLREIPDETVVEIVDDIWLPLLKPGTSA